VAAGNEAEGYGRFNSNAAAMVVAAHYACHICQSARKVDPRSNCKIDEVDDARSRLRVAVA
jgi:hypothetical protein